MAWCMCMRLRTAQTNCMWVWVWVLLCSGALESEFVGLMREHRALARVDLRACSGRGGKDMGILKVMHTAST